MLDVLRWFIAAEAIGFAAFPIAYHLLPRLQDRGYSVSKPLGILLVGYASWILSQLHILPSVRLSVLALVVVMAAFSAWYARGRAQELRDFVRREWRALLAAEAIFIALFLVWAVYRAYDPSIDHTEKPMDFAFLNVSVRSFLGPPQDPWLAGGSVSYYYFGYWMMGSVTELTGTATSVAYNLALALVPALAGVGVFGLVYNMVRPEGRRLAYAVSAGVAAAVLLTVAANLEGVLEFMRANGMGSQRFWNWVSIDGLNRPLPEAVASWRPDEFWWWFRATRVINTFSGGQGTDYTIQEFPFFSFILGDLHPHVMSIPFVLLFVALCLNFLSRPQGQGAWAPVGWSLARFGVTLPTPRLEGAASVAALGLTLGGLAFTNMWDLPVFAAMFLGVAALRSYTAHGGDLLALLKGTVPVGVAVIGLAFLLFLPYHLSFTSQFTGLKPVVAATTRPVHLFLVWGLLLVAVAPFVLAVFWRSTVNSDWPGQVAAALFVASLPYLAWAFLHLQAGGQTGDLLPRLYHVLPMALMVGVAVYSTLWLAREGAPVGRVFALLMASLGLLLIMVPELVYVGDFFRTRMNTVFKLYYQAWILLAAASGFAVYYWACARRSGPAWGRLAANLWRAVFVVLLAGSLYYAPAAAATKGDLFEGRATLDGLDYLARTQPGEYEAIKHLSKRAGRGATVLEAVGGEYNDYGRVSASTGVPTVLEWVGHQLQWRGSSDSFQGREQDVARIYQTQDAEEAKSLLAKYGVDYVYVGHRERAKYGMEGLAKFARFMDLEFSGSEVEVYRTRR